jgi:hypothetical protein
VVVETGIAVPGIGSTCSSVAAAPGVVGSIHSSMYMGTSVVAVGAVAPVPSRTASVEP